MEETWLRFMSRQVYEWTPTIGILVMLLVALPAMIYLAVDMMEEEDRYGR